MSDNVVLASDGSFFVGREHFENPDRAEQEAAFTLVQITQAAFWDALFELEQLTDRSLNQNKDFSDLSLADVLEGRADEDENAYDDD